MTKDQIRFLAETYSRILREAGVKPQIVDPDQPLSRDEMLAHCLWVLEERFEQLLDRIGGFQEAIRLVGCIQGTVMACGLCTITETREHAQQAKFITWEQTLA